MRKSRYRPSSTVVVSRFSVLLYSFIRQHYDTVFRAAAGQPARHIYGHYARQRPFPRRFQALTMLARCRRYVRNSLLQAFASGASIFGGLFVEASTPFKAPLPTLAVLLHQQNRPILKLRAPTENVLLT